MGKDRLICVGAFLGAHGVRGDVRVRSLTEDPEAIFSYEPLVDKAGERVFKLQAKGIGKDCFIASVRGVADREAAQALRGTKIFVARSSLPQVEDGVFYEADLVGLPVRSEDGGAIGKVTALHDYGAGSFLEIAPDAGLVEAKGKSFMLPFSDAFVPVVDLEAGFVTAILPSGWLGSEGGNGQKEEA